ncbi:MAG: hypothetical protein ACRYFK_12360 [Janthinobacterium lividum]
MKRSYLLRWCWLLLLGLGRWVAASWPSYQPPAAAALRPRLSYLARVINEGAAPGTALGRLTAANPEWGLFSLSFSTYGLANQAARQPALRPEAARIMEQAVQVALSAPVRQPFLEGPATSCAGYALPQSVLYLGHLNLMLGCHRRLDPASPYARLHDAVSACLYRRLALDPAGNLTSYPGRRWLPDNTVALASLALHSRLTGSPYAQAGSRWVARARREWLDPATGLLASMVDAAGRPAEEPRGSHLGWSIWFLAQVDAGFARQQYARYQAAYSTNLGALRLYRETAGSLATGAGDVDSGPLMLGYGIPATTFAFADAVALGDYRNAQRLRRVISLGSKELTTGPETRFTVRLIGLDVSPLAEALLLWADVPAPKSR